MALTHGHTRGGQRLPEYRSWNAMKARCLNPKHVFFKNYGGRGITIAPEWVNDFAAFLGYVGPKPSPKHSLDRIDNSKGYQPGNVRWVLHVRQARNRRSTKLTFEMAECIRYWLKAGLKDVELAFVFDVHPTTIRDVKCRRQWRAA